jgi:cardiolipin synthase (CMP-forming)
MSLKELNWAFYVFILAGMTDAIDGWIARYFKLQTNFGRFVDPIADKILIITSVLALGYNHELPLSLILLILVRDLTIFIGIFIWFKLFKKMPEIHPTFISKVNTTLQIILVILCLLESTFTVHTPKSIIMYATYLTTAISFVDYVFTWSKKAWKKKH